jgi:hypothetical protein
MRTPIASLLILALAAAPLAGCGQPSLAGAPGVRMAGKVKAKSADASAMAVRFAEAIKPSFAGQIGVKGAVVSLRFEETVTYYDFKDTPATGVVLISADEFTTEMPLEDLMRGAAVGGQGTEALPVLLVPIATQVAIAAAKALAMYYITHRGEEFDKGDAAKATVVAMGLAMIPFVGAFGTAGQFLPVATKLLATSGSFAYKDLAKAAIGMVDEIVPLVLALIKARRAGGAEAAAR